jgi:epoxide hydrolase-like predicted phosphatase
MANPIRALIFDVGGVLVRTEDPTPRQQLAAKLNLSVRALYSVAFGGDTWRQVQLGRVADDEHWRAVGHRLGLAWPDEVHAFRETFFEGDRLDRQLIELIVQLRDRYKVALLSNAPANLRRWIVDEWDIPPDTFDAIVISAEQGVMKPDPEIYRVALARLDVAPHEAIFVDDFVENIKAARMLGIEAIHFTSPEVLVEELESRIDVPYD